MRQAAEEAGCFRTLLAIMRAAGLEAILCSESPLTVFAPTDTAFENVPGDLMDTVLLYPEVLAKLLAHHTLPFRISYEDMLRLGRKRLLYGKLFEICAGTVRVGGALCTHPDIPSAGGLLHGIDRVLLPQRLMAALR